MNVSCFLFGGASLGAQTGLCIPSTLPPSLCSLPPCPLSPLGWRPSTTKSPMLDLFLQERSKHVLPFSAQLPVPLDVDSYPFYGMTHYLLMGHESGHCRQQGRSPSYTFNFPWLHSRPLSGEIEGRAEFMAGMGTFLEAIIL